jgi:hypothetical protein
VNERPRFWLTVLGAHTHLHATACSACPHHVFGCCSHPPPYDWADVARVLSLGGRAHLEGALARGDLTLTRGGLRFATPKRRGPRGKRVQGCVFLGEAGCVLDPREKPAVCNYYVCETALGGPPERNPHGDRPFFAYAVVRELWTRWTHEVGRVVDEAYRDACPAFDEALVTLLVETYERLEREAGLEGARPEPLPGPTVR